MNRKTYKLEDLLDDIIFEGVWPEPEKDKTIKYKENGETKNYDTILVRILYEEENEEVCFPKSESVYLVAFATNGIIHDLYAVGVASRIYRNVKTESDFRPY